MYVLWWFGDVDLVSLVDVLHLAADKFKIHLENFPDTRPTDSIHVFVGGVVIRVPLCALPLLVTAVCRFKFNVYSANYYVYDDDWFACTGTPNAKTYATNTPFPQYIIRIVFLAWLFAVSLYLDLCLERKHTVIKKKGKRNFDAKKWYLNIRFCCWCCCCCCCDETFVIVVKWEY